MDSTCILCIFSYKPTSQVEPPLPPPSRPPPMTDSQQIRLLRSLISEEMDYVYEEYSGELPDELPGYIDVIDVLEDWVGTEKMLKILTDLGEKQLFFCCFVKVVSTKFQRFQP